jgi:hypothetical protein
MTDTIETAQPTEADAAYAYEIRMLRTEIMQAVNALAKRCTRASMQLGNLDERLAADTRPLDRDRIQGLSDQAYEIIFALGEQFDEMSDKLNPDAEEDDGEEDDTTEKEEPEEDEEENAEDTDD